MESKLVKEMENIYKKTFKKSRLNASYGCFGKDTIFVDLFLAENKDEVFNGYFDNDMFNIVFEIKDYGNGNYLLENVRNTYSLKADNKYMYYSSKRVNFRKVNGDETKILNAFSKFVERLYASLLEDIKADKIHDSFKELLNSKIGD